MSFEFEQDSFCLNLLTPSSEQFMIELDTIELLLQALDCGGVPCSALTILYFTPLVVLPNYLLFY